MTILIFCKIILYTFYNFHCNLHNLAKMGNDNCSVSLRHNREIVRSRYAKGELSLAYCRGGVEGTGLSPNGPLVHGCPSLTNIVIVADLRLAPRHGAPRISLPFLIRASAPPARRQRPAPPGLRGIGSGSASPVDSTR